MGWTRRQFINAAHTEIGLADYDFDISPEQYQTAARRLDSMLLEWNARGLRLGPNIAASVDGAQLDVDVGLPDAANEAVILGLACRIAPSYGKTVSPQTMIGAKNALTALYGVFAKPPEMQFPGTLPAGAGNKPWRFGNDPFIVPPSEQVTVGNDSALEA